MISILLARDHFAHLNGLHFGAFTLLEWLGIIWSFVSLIRHMVHLDVNKTHRASWSDFFGHSVIFLQKKHCVLHSQKAPSAAGPCCAAADGLRWWSTSCWWGAVEETSRASSTQNGEVQSKGPRFVQADQNWASWYAIDWRIQKTDLDPIEVNTWSNQVLQPDLELVQVWTHVFWPIQTWKPDFRNPKVRKSLALDPYSDS